MKRFEKSIYILLSTCITIVFLLLFMIIKKMEPFGDYSLVNYDCQSQIYPFLCTLQNKLRSGESFIYNWEGGLGDGFLPTYFYYLSSPFNLFVVFVEKNHIRAFINIIIFLRIVLSASSMSVYLSSKRVTDEKTQVFIIPLSCAYALSGYIFGYYHESMWLDSYMIFPVILLGYDRMIKNRKPMLYILSLVYSCVCSFYMTFMIGVVLVLWFILDEHESVRGFFKNAIIMGISSVIAIGMTAFSIIVSYIGVTKTHVSAEPDITHKWFGNLFNIVRYQFPLSSSINISYDNNCANLYCGIFVILLTFLYTFSNKINPAIRIKRIFLLVFMLISMNESVLNYVWHGFHYQIGIPNRFSFVLICIILITSYEALDCVDDIKKRFIGVGIALTLALTILTYFYSGFDSQYSVRMVLLISVGMVVLYGLFVLLRTVAKNRLISIIFAVFMLCEIMINSYISLSAEVFTAGRYDGVLADTEVLRENISSAETDQQFYRAKLLGTTLHNTNNVASINGVQLFSSMVSNNVLQFGSKFGIFRTDVSIDENGGYEPLDDILGVRYLYTNDEQYTSKIGYDYVDSLNNVEVYRNNNALSLGYGVSNDITSLVLDKEEVIDNVNGLVSSMTGCGNVLEEVIPEYSISGDGYGVEFGDVDYFYSRLVPVKSYDQSYIQVEFDVAETGRYNMYMNFSDYGIITVSVNDEIRRYEFTSFGGMLSLGSLNENDRVKVRIQPDEKSIGDSDIQPYLELRFLKINEEEYQRFLDVLKQNQMVVDLISGGHLEADVNLKDNQMLFTSIPYDDCWHVYENGTELQTKEVADAFLGVELGEGEHKLVFKYIPGGFYAGIIISIVSWILFIIWIIITSHIPSAGTKKGENESDEANG